MPTANIRGAGAWIRQTHRWISIAFTVTVIANFAARIKAEPPLWVTYAPLLPLAVLLMSGLYLFAQPYTRKRRAAAERTSELNIVSPNKLSAVIHSRHALHEGFLRLYKYEIDIEGHGGGITRTSWEMMERGNAVAVLGHDPNRGEVVLGNEFRPGVLVAGEYPYRDNLVAGSIEPNETALQAGVREMREETGLLLSNPTLIHSGAYVSSGGTSEKIAIVYGTVDTGLAGGVHGNAAENEDILTVVMPVSVFNERVRSGEINDLKTLVAGYWFAEHLAARKI